MGWQRVIFLSPSCREWMCKTKLSLSSNSDERNSISCLISAGCNELPLNFLFYAYI